MSNFRELIKEEFVKAFIDKLLFGLVAVAIVFYFDSIKRKQIEKEAIFRLESNFILNESKILQSSFSEYIAIISEVMFRGSVREGQEQSLRIITMKMVSSLTLLSTLNTKLKNDSDNFKRNFRSLTDLLLQYDISKNPKYEEKFNNLNSQYKRLLSLVKFAAIESLSNNINIATKKD